MESEIIFIIILLILCIFIYLGKYSMYSINNSTSTNNSISNGISTNNSINTSNGMGNDTSSTIPHLEDNKIDINVNNITQREDVLYDPITRYDYRILDDPMKDPKRRIARHSMMPLGLQLASYPTRGWRDTFSLQGYLIDKHASINDANKVLQLFGREKWPNSNKFEYYVTFQSGNQERKYELDKYTKELYDKDEVRVDIMNNKKYQVKLFKQESFEYNPFI